MLCRSIHSGLGVNAHRTCTASLSNQSLIARRVVVSRQRWAQSTLVLTTYASAEAAEAETVTTAPETDTTSSSSDSSNATGAVTSIGNRPPPGDNVLYAVQLAKGGSPPDEAVFETHVKQCEGVQEVSLVTNTLPSGEQRYVGYVVFDTEENAQAARETLDQSVFNGQKIKVRTHRREPVQQPRKPTAKVPPPYTVANYVRVDNVAWATMDEDLEEHFKGTDGVIDAFITYWRGRPSGHGYVRFNTEEQAAAAVKALQASTLDGRELKLRKMEPARAETAPLDATASSQASKPPPSTLKGASETETRIVVKQLPSMFSWREVLGMCSVFGQVQRTAMVNKTRNKRSLAAAVVEDSSKESQNGDAEQPKQQQLIPAAIVYFADRESAEKAIAGLNGLTVQGNELRVNIYRAQREKAQAKAAEGATDDAAAVEDAADDANGSKGGEQA